MGEIKTNPTVSVIIPTYNRAHMVGRAIQSVLNQMYKEFELIVVDDGSTDNTEEVVKGFGDERLRYIRLSEKSGGSAVPRNTGLKVARGEYIACLDDDDSWLDRDKLKAQVEFLSNNLDYVLVGTNSIVVDENGRELSRTLFAEKDNEIRNKLLEQNCFFHSSVMYKKSAAMIFSGYSQVKGTRYSNYSNDYELWLIMGTLGRLANLSMYGIKHTASPTDISKKSRTSLCIKDIRLIRKYKDEYPNYWRAIRVRWVGVLNILSQVISDLPPFLGLKKLLKSRCPACWRLIKLSHRALFRGIF